MEPAANSILIVEDDPIFREITVDALVDAGYPTRDASDGAAAIEILRNTPPGILLLDVSLPKVSGSGVLDHVGTMERPPHVVLMSAADQIATPGCLTRHVQASLLKPFSVRQLFRTLAAVLAGPSGASGQRTEARRPFVVDAVVAGAGYWPAQGRLVQVSPHGFRAESRHPFRPGDAVSVSFVLPGRTGPLRLQGRVRWCGGETFGALIESPTAAEAEFLGDRTA
jgi:CheY-like chemotaxis protein